MSEGATLGRFPRPRSFVQMEGEMSRDQSSARALREANKVFKQVEPKKPMSEYAKAEQAFQKNRERLKAERLAREGKPRSRPE